MCFYGSLGYVQIASNFRIVTTLQEKLDDLLLPLPHLSKFLFHVVPLTGRASLTASASHGDQRCDALNSGVCTSVMHPRGHSEPDPA